MVSLCELPDSLHLEILSYEVCHKFKYVGLNRMLCERLLRKVRYLVIDAEDFLTTTQQEEGKEGREESRSKEGDPPLTASHNNFQIISGREQGFVARLICPRHKVH